MKKNNIFIKIFLVSLFLFIIPVNLICMNNSGESNYSSNSFDNNGLNKSEAQILESLKLNDRAKKREVLIDVLYQGSGIGLQPKIGDTIGRYFEKNEAVDNFFDFKIVNNNSNNQIRPFNNDQNYGENNKSPEIKSMSPRRIKPFNCDSWGDIMDKAKEEVAKSAPSKGKLDIFMKRMSNMTVSDNVVNGDKNSLYLMEVCNNTVKIIKKSNNKIVFNVRVLGNICKIGATIYFDGDLRKNKNSYGIEYVLIIFSSKEKCQMDNKKELGDFVCLYDKDAKIIFVKQIDQQVCSYHLVDSEEYKLIAIIFENFAALFDIKTEKEIAKIDYERKVTDSFLWGCKDGIFFSANNTIKLISKNKENDCENSFDNDFGNNINKEKENNWHVKVYDFKETIVSGESYPKYLIFKSKASGSKDRESSYFINFFNKAHDKIIDKFELCNDNTCDVMEKMDNLYFWTKDKCKKCLKIYSICNTKIEKFFSKNFKHEIYDFGILNHKIDKYKKLVCVSLFNHENKKFKNKSFKVRLKDREPKEESDAILFND